MEGGGSQGQGNENGQKGGLQGLEEKGKVAGRWSLNCGA